MHIEGDLFNQVPHVPVKLNACILVISVSVYELFRRNGVGKNNEEEGKPQREIGISASINYVTRTLNDC